MLKLKKETLMAENTVQRVQFENEIYFDVDSVASFIKEDLSDVKGIQLPFGGEYKNAAKLEDIEAGRKQEELSEFNKALLKAKNYPKMKNFKSNENSKE